MPLISIISSVYAPSATYLDETIASVQTLALPAGWELEWIVQEDGAQPSLGDRLQALGVVKYNANSGQFGLAITRNLALARASGSLVQSLDHDDILLPDSLRTLIPVSMTRESSGPSGKPTTSCQTAPARPTSPRYRSA